MHFTATVLLAFGMSMDAFAASIGKGATLHKPKFSEALRTGLIFGAVETLTPLIGWGLGIATSLDAMAVGVGLAFLQVNIIATALAIGCATLIMSTLGMMIGRFIGPMLGKRAEILGGVVLIGIGVQILWTHFHG